MSTTTAGNTGRIFISYRREETAYSAGWLFERLAGHFGRDKIFKDVDSIDPGDDFVAVITTAVGSCDVLLALIGDRWLTITGKGGQRRLDDPDDFVRLEIEAALTRNVRVVPILVEGAQMPRADELPTSLADLVRRQALELSPSRFDSDIRRLLRVLDKTLNEAQARPVATDHGHGVDKRPEAREQARQETGLTAAEHYKQTEQLRHQDQRDEREPTIVSQPQARETKTAAAETRAPVTPKVPQSRAWVLSRPPRQYLFCLISCFVLFIAAIVGINKARPRSGLSYTMGWIIGLSLTGALLSLGFLLYARRVNRD